MKSNGIPSCFRRDAAPFVVALAIAMGFGQLALAADHYRHEPGDSGHMKAVASTTGADSRGIDLGSFRIRAYYPVQAQKSVVSFRLYVTVKGNRKAEMRRLVENRRHKIRDQVITAARLVPLSELNEPDLASFRKRIKVRLHRTVPELWIDDLYVSAFELTVQSL